MIPLFLYRVGFILITPFLIVLFFIRRLKGKESKTRFCERLGYPKMARPDGKLIWMHGASVGECLSMMPLINKLLAMDDKLHIMVTSGTVTSADLMAKRLPDRAFHQFIPIDSPWGARHFVRHFHADAVLWFESDFWPNLLASIHAAKIPLVLLNGRISDKSFQRWMRARWFLRPILRFFTLTLGQSVENTTRLKELGSPLSDCVGNLKYAAPPAPYDAAELERLLAGIGNRECWCGASTHNNEEEQMADVHLELKKTHEDLLTICVPRHPHRADDIEKMLVKKGLKVARRSRGEEIKADTDFYVADTIGEMGLLYRLAPIVFVGGSLIPFGGQNMLEPMSLRRAVIIGPHAFNFREIVQSAKESQALLEVPDKNALGAMLGYLLNTPTARQEIAERAEIVATSEMAVLDRLYECLKAKGII
ncbi:MAG: 3-deoxy-D-manno-octulosonic acid transferase [Alphaproteobacteria bacterium]|nr:3-deoxy-D-manno-octulosonic acid transferase [Alphaproteobacteria bacterium]